MILILTDMKQLMGNRQQQIIPHILSAGSICHKGLWIPHVDVDIRFMDPVGNGFSHVWIFSAQFFYQKFDRPLGNTDHRLVPQIHVRSLNMTEDRLDVLRNFDLLLDSLILAVFLNVFLEPFHNTLVRIEPVIQTSARLSAHLFVRLEILFCLRAVFLFDLFQLFQFFRLVRINILYFVSNQEIAILITSGKLSVAQPGIVPVCPEFFGDPAHNYRSSHHENECSDISQDHQTVLIAGDLIGAVLQFSAIFDQFVFIINAIYDDMILKFFRNPKLVQIKRHCVFTRETFMGIQPSVELPGTKRVDSLRIEIFHNSHGTLILIVYRCHRKNGIFIQLVFLCCNTYPFDRRNIHRVAVIGHLRQRVLLIGKGIIKLCSFALRAAAAVLIRRFILMGHQKARILECTDPDQNRKCHNQDLVQNSPGTLILRFRICRCCFLSQRKFRLCDFWQGHPFRFLLRRNIIGYRRRGILHRCCLWHLKTGRRCCSGLVFRWHVQSDCSFGFRSGLCRCTRRHLKRSCCRFFCCIDHCCSAFDAELRIISKLCAAFVTIFRHICSPYGRIRQMIAFTPSFVCIIPTPYCVPLYSQKYLICSMPGPSV